MITINNTMPGVIKNIEVKGNTYQDPNNLSKIVSAGISNGDGTYKMSILSSNGLGKADINYKETKCDITLPRPLRSTFDKSVKDRLYYDKKSKNWCIEQNVDDESNILGDGVSIIHQLPKDIDIFLESYAERTDVWVESGEISAITKVTASKSMASTVLANTNEINILNDKIADIQGLKESQDFAYELPNGQNYLVCKDTQNGTVKDLKIYGKSVVNVAPKSIAPIKLSIDKRVNDTTLISPILANTEFTVGVNVTAKKAPLKGLLISFRFADGTFAYDVLTTGVYSQFKTFKFSKDVMAISEYLHLDELTADATANITFDSLIVCEGVINTYFEGIASVGNGNEVEVLSSDNGNLFDGEFIKGTVNGVDGNLIPDTNGYMITQKNIIKVFPGISVKYKSTGARGFRPGKNVLYYYYDKSEKIISRGSLNTFDEISIPNGCYGLRLTFADFELNSSFNASNYNMTLNQIGTLDNPNFAKQDKKTILFKDEDNTWKPVTNLRGIDETNCDVVDTTSNKYIKKYEKVVISSSNGFKVVTTSSNDKTVQFWNDGHTLFPKIIKNNRNCICDKLKIELTTNKDEEYFLNGSVSFVISLDKTKASNLEQLNSYLSNNPITFVYEVSVEEYELNPIYPDSYDNETMILFGSGVIAPHASWKITSSLPNFLSNVEDRVSYLEKKTMEDSILIMTMLLNHEARLIAQSI